MSEQTERQTVIREDLARNLERLEDLIASSCRAANRARSEVELVAVSKNHPAEALVAAVELRLRVFGENRVQEFAAKSVELAAAGVRGRMRAHLIGHLQSNKAAKAVEVFDAVDSVDSLRLAERLDEAAGRIGKRLPVLLEIKLSHEESKAGLAPDSTELAELLEKLPSLHNLEAQGLMTIAPLDVPEDETRGCFRALKLLRDRFAVEHPRLNLPVLSMGMSGDFSLAIAEGATRIRVGTALFGMRPGYPK
ncbi:YggS family pyridoxal phosphate-dependent enzyme [Acidicapsa acidisoli]|uniref:YggS family pyridoxal phosphate-dependent enzyme n=1 Tax=Acidicapsa acidisoli TaxID=1615681 RepID=UPI0021E09376|nr:YggS family pyridoxal phosphate-dependent enzyme [Acidicapsa acidisoli]